MRLTTVCHTCSADRLDGAFDFIVSNPPYIPTRDLAGLAPEVSDWEDPKALDGGLDGLDVAREILDRAPRVLARDGARVVWMELDTTGPGLLQRDLGRRCDQFHDFSGRPRFVKVRV